MNAAPLQLFEMQLKQGVLGILPPTDLPLQFKAWQCQAREQGHEGQTQEAFYQGKAMQGGGMMMCHGVSMRSERGRGADLNLQIHRMKETESWRANSGTYHVEMQPHKSMYPWQQGQSLIETLFVLFVLAVMCGVTASSMLWMQRKIQIQTAAEDLLNAVLTARTEALRREKRVTLCVALNTSNEPDGLPIACEAVTSFASKIPPTWQQGWLMFVDDNGNGMRDVGEELLLQHAKLPLSVSATGNSTVNRYISFGANGRSLILNGGFQAGTLTFCEHLMPASAGWLLVINAVGRPRLEKTQVAQC